MSDYPAFATLAGLHHPNADGLWVELAKPAGSRFHLTCYGCGWSNTTTVDIIPARKIAQEHASQCTGLGVPPASLDD